MLLWCLQGQFMPVIVFVEDGLNLDTISFKLDILHKDYHWHKLALQTPEQH
jgi:hypothetical protein